MLDIYSDTVTPTAELIEHHRKRLVDAWFTSDMKRQDTDNVIGTSIVERGTITRLDIRAIHFTLSALYKEAYFDKPKNEWMADQGLNYDHWLKTGVSEGLMLEVHFAKDDPETGITFEGIANSLEKIYRKLDTARGIQ